MEEGEIEEGELPPPDAAAAAAAAEAEARAARAAAGLEDDELEEVMMGCEEMCNLAEQAAEAARACAASSRIGKRVVELGGGGWGVLCDCAQTVLRTSRAASGCVTKVGYGAMRTPAHVTAALDSATEKTLGKRAEREVRGLMESILASVRAGREATAKARECTDKAADGAQVVLSLIRLPPNPERLQSAVGAHALANLMGRVADVLSEMATAVGEAAETAMSTAVSVESMHRMAAIVTNLASAAEAKEAADDLSSSGSSEDEDEDEEVRRATREAKRKAAEEEARRREAEAARREAEAANQVDPEEGLGAGAKQRLANARMLRKLSKEVAESQTKLRELVSAAPQLIAMVSVGQKEATFQQLAEFLAAAEQPIAHAWYAQGPAPASDAARPPAEAAAEASRAADEWVGFVGRRLEFVFHAADVDGLPVPSSLGARLLRHAALIDAELTSQVLRTQLLSRVMLFAPEAAGGSSALRPQLPQLAALAGRLEAAVQQLTASHAGVGGGETP